MLIKFSPKIDHLNMVKLNVAKAKTAIRDMIMLSPGTNEVTDDEWNCMKDNLQDAIENGEIVVLEQNVKKNGVQIRAKNLKDMPPRLAIQYVNECTNPRTLQMWDNTIVNEEVRLAIAKRMQTLQITSDETVKGNTDDEKDEEKDEIDEALENAEETENDNKDGKQKRKKAD